jgi:peptidoglycan/xylan/chitin deacetylase (PgdA/CDA1 family)
MSCACDFFDGENDFSEQQQRKAGASTKAFRAVFPGRDRPLPCTITGTGGDDILFGTPGDDVICGLGGDDTITGAAGDDLLSGGADTDTVSFSSTPNAVTVRIDSSATGDGKDVLSGFENAIGSSNDDRLVGAPGRNTLRGGPGADILESRDRDPYDVLDAGDAADLCIADPGDWRRGCRHPRVRSHGRAVPILMYHVISNPPHTAPFKELWVSPRVFERQMTYLDQHGYEVVSLQEVYDYWHGGPLPAKPVVVSFDDGFRSHYGRALPILAAQGWAGTLNLALSHYNKREWGLNGRMIRALILADWELDCHSRTHAHLPGLRASKLDSEVARARRFLRVTFHVPVDFFAYPSGAFDATVVEAVRTAGFEGATTTEYGLARPSEPFRLDRIAVSRSDGVAGLAAKLGRLGG